MSNISKIIYYYPKNSFIFYENILWDIKEYFGNTQQDLYTQVAIGQVWVKIIWKIEK